jgi:hypothetical protein
MKPSTRKRLAAQPKPAPKSAHFTDEQRLAATQAREADCIAAKVELLDSLSAAFTAMIAGIRETL